MCGVVAALLCLYCRSGCKADIVASALTFHPPDPPYYEFVYNEELNIYSLALAEDVPSLQYENTSVTVIKSKENTNIPIVMLKNNNAKYTLIYSHGNATDCGAMFIIYAMLALALKINVVGYDYSGYGISNSINDNNKYIKPSERQTYSDIESVYDWVVENVVSDPSKEIILYGQSVGSGPSTYLATKKPIAGLVLHSPIMSGLRVITKSRFLSCWDIYPNIERISQVTCPVFILHGTEDREVDFSHGLNLYNLVPAELQMTPWWVAKRGHNDILHGNEAEFIRRLASFIEFIDNHNKDTTSIIDTSKVLTNTPPVSMSIEMERLTSVNTLAIAVKNEEDTETNS